METLLQLLLKSMSQQSSIDAAEKKTGISGVSILTILSYALPILIRFLISRKTFSSRRKRMQMQRKRNPLLQSHIR